MINLVFLLIAIQQPITHTAYLPMIVQSYPDTCAKFGLAWRGGGDGGAAQSEFLCGHQAYYHSGSYLPTYRENGGIPMLWCDIDDRDGRNYLRLAAEWLIGWNGIALDQNEPDVPGQCDRSPGQSALISLMFRRMLPDAQLIGPNTVYPDYLWQYLNEYKRLSGSLPELPIGVHIYEVNDRSDARARVDRFCGVLLSVGYSECRLWVTEAGICANHPQAQQTANLWAQQLLDDPRVEQLYWYTNYNPPTGDCDLNLFTSAGGTELTALGHGVYDALYGHEYPMVQRQYIAD